MYCMTSKKMMIIMSSLKPKCKGSAAKATKQKVQLFPSGVKVDF